jgi:hypothetical protein
MKQLCNDVRQFAIQVHEIGYSPNGAVAERECLALSEHMLAAVKQAEVRTAGAKYTTIARCVSEIDELRAELKLTTDERDELLFAINKAEARRTGSDGEPPRRELPQQKEFGLLPSINAACS